MSASGISGSFLPASFTLKMRLRIELEKMKALRCALGALRQRRKSVPPTALAMQELAGEVEATLYRCQLLLQQRL